MPINVTDISQYYYLDLFLSTVAGTPSVLYPTRSTTAVGTAYGTYVQVSPFGNYLTSASGIASALLCNCTATSNLSGVYSSNAYRIALTTSNGWTVNGTSTSLAVTANGNFQVNQSGIYEVNMCLNTVGNTPVQFQIGSLSSDAASPGAGTQYLYTYAPMYTQDPTTVIQLPLNITNISNVYFVECSFAGTVTGNVALNATSTFVSVKPIGGYINTGTNPWTQQGTSVYYNGGPVGVGGVNPSSLTETFTVSGTSAFVSNVTVTSDASGNAYVLADRVPAGSLHVSSYVTGSVPLTTTTNLIQKYLSNAATVSATGVGGYGPTIYYPGTANSRVVIPFQTSVMRPASNLFMEAWVYLGSTSAPSTVAILTSENTAGGLDDFSIRFLGNPINSVQFYIYNTLNSAAGTPSATYSFPVGWVYVAASYNATAGTSYIFYCVAGTSTVSTAGTLAGTQRVTAGNNLYIGSRQAAGTDLNGHIYDARIIRGGVVPTGTYTINSSTPYLFSSAPTYRTGMDTGYTSNLTLALQSQYFPGASTSPYGPCLTLPGTVGSYYTQTNAALGQNWKTYGFTLESWVNYASLANSNVYYSSAPLPYCIAQTSNGNGNLDWGFGPTTTGALSFFIASSSPFAYYSISTPINSITTGQWMHIALQVSLTAISLYVNGVAQTLTAWNFTNTGSSTASSIPTTTPQSSLNALTVGQWIATGGLNANFSIAKARIVYGSATTTGNVYSMAGFTPSPNLGPVPAGATIAWSLDSQFPLPTFPSIQDVTQLPPQSTSYGAVPTPVGGVTSNVFGPYSTTYPQLDSIRFDGTGYIDYGNAASSVMTSNIWASPWTIEGWVYFSSTSFSGAQPLFTRAASSGGTSAFDFWIWIQSFNQLQMYTPGGGLYASGGSVQSGWNHVAVVFNGSSVLMYLNGTQNSSTALNGQQTFTPSYNFYIGTQGPALGGVYTGGTGNLTGNLADLRVSNVARYTGSTYTVPNVADGSGPFVADSSTLLLLKSLAGQVGTTLEVQGRGLNAVSLGATRSVQSYPPAPMSSYLLDTTGNTAVSYGQGKYVASASTESTNPWPAWQAFDGSQVTYWQDVNSSLYSSSSPYGYIASVTTVDVLGNPWAGEWCQLQLPVSVLLSSYSVQGFTAPYGPASWVLLGSRDGTNWTFVDRRTGITWSGSLPVTIQTFTVNVTQAYNYYRYIVLNTVGNSQPQGPTIATLSFSGTEESLCVTSDSKVGVGIANPQRALEVAGDLVVSGTISGGAGMGSFRNRIINGDMRIAQRGTTATYTTSGQNYLIDRFNFNHNISAGSVIVSQRQLTASDTPYQLGFRNSMNVFVSSAITFSYAEPQQNMEGLMTADFNWGTPFGSPATFSLWFRSNWSGPSEICCRLTESATSNTYHAPFTTVGSGTWQYLSFTIPPPPNGVPIPIDNSKCLIWYIAPKTTSGTTGTNQWLQTSISSLSGSTNWYTNAGNYIEFTGVQLEKGTVATPFEVRPFATELALCQRYLFQLSPQDTAPCYQRNAVLGLYTIRFPVTMRTGVNPTISGGFNVSLGATDTTQTSLTTPGGAYQPSATGSQYNFPSAQTIGLAGHISINASGYIRYDAEL